MRLEQRSQGHAAWQDLDLLVEETYDLLDPKPEPAEIEQEAPAPTDEAALEAQIIAALARSADPRSLLDKLIAGMPPLHADEDAQPDASEPPSDETEDGDA